jgi:hypothetical protein
MIDRDAARRMIDWDSFHPATDDIARACRGLALLIDALPDGLAKSLAFTKLEETLFWSSSAAREEP